ncbi:hypothetical protein [Namhaeicola litoreus]|uniref:Uncharacterized protein n=1 Tax=Namhaeicola litoreus TaxID=1052145 RepID=A0ABW3Y2C4_9FLAO
MRFLKNFVVICLIVPFFSCSTNDELKEISGSYAFNQAGKHTFVVNAENIVATIKLVGANQGETVLLDNVALNRNVEYTAIVGDGIHYDTEIWNNLVPEYIAKSGNKDLNQNGYIKIDWIGFD